LKYIISLLTIVIIFSACQKKEIVIYDVKNKTDINKTKEIAEVNEIKNVKYENIVKNDVNSTIAIMYSSKKIGKYSIKLSNIASIYASSNKNMSLKFIDLEDESDTLIEKEFNNLKEDNIYKVLFFITKNNLDNLYKYKYVNEFDIYLPLVNKQNNIEHKNIVYGAIDYKKQFDFIKSNAKSHIVEIYDNTYRSKMLHNASKDENVTSYILSGKYPNYKRFLNKYKLIQGSSLILNVSLVKSSILLSQITANDDVNIVEALSAQNNFTPTIFALTQNKDIENLIIANSISLSNERIENMSRLLGSDISYDWVNYSTILGLEYLKYKEDVLFGNIQVIDNEVKYPIKLYKARKNSFRAYIKEVNATINYENIN